MLPQLDLERSTVTHVRPGKYFIRDGAVYQRIDFIKKNWYECFNYATYQYDRLGSNATVYILPEHFSVAGKPCALSVYHKTLADTL